MRAIASVSRLILRAEIKNRIPTINEITISIAQAMAFSFTLYGNNNINLVH